MDNPNEISRESIVSYFRQTIQNLTGGRGDAMVEAVIQVTADLMVQQQRLIMKTLQDLHVVTMQNGMMRVLPQPLLSKPQYIWDPATCSETEVMAQMSGFPDDLLIDANGDIVADSRNSGLLAGRMVKAFNGTLKSIADDDKTLKPFSKIFVGLEPMCDHDWVTWTGLHGTQTDCSKCKAVRKNDDEGGVNID